MHFNDNKIYKARDSDIMLPQDFKDHFTILEYKGFRLEKYSNPPPGDLHLPGFDAHCLIHTVTPFTGIVHHECAGEKNQINFRPNCLGFIPAGADTRWVYNEMESTTLHLMIDASSVRKNIGHHFKPENINTFRYDCQFQSQELLMLLKLSELEMNTGGLNGPLYADTLATALSIQLLNYFNPGHKTIGFETDCDVSRAYELINDEYYRNIPLDELAATAGLSRAQFVRRFRQQYGTSPHQCLIQRRIEIARLKLAYGNYASLANLALELGFADQSHFHRHFSALTGVTPFLYIRNHE